MDDLTNEQFPDARLLKAFKQADGSLLVGNQVLFPSAFLDGQIIYNYNNSNENFQFILEDSHSNIECIL